MFKTCLHGRNSKFSRNLLHQAVLQLYRDDNKLFNILFARATEMNGDQIAPQMVTGRQQNRTIVPAEKLHEYYHCAVFSPCVVICMAHLHGY